MVLFFIHSEPRPSKRESRSLKGILTPKKVERMNSLRAAALKRHSRIKAVFDRRPNVRQLIEQIDTVEAKINNLHLASKKNPTAANKTELKKFTLFHTNSQLQYLKDFRKFAVEQNPGHSFINELDSSIAEVKALIKEVTYWKI